MESIMMEFIEILRNNPDGAYDFIANNYYKFSKSELADIIKEFIYTVYDESKFGLLTEEDYDKIHTKTADGLEDIYEEEA